MTTPLGSAGSEGRDKKRMVQSAMMMLRSADDWDARTSDEEGENE